MKKKYLITPTEKLKDNTSYLKNNDNTEAKKIVEQSKDLPHLKKPIKFMLKR
jgi:hypothetical protein